MSDSPATPVTTALTTDMLLHHWQGHRGLTRRVIEAFPEAELFRFSAGGMRTFGAMALELIAMVAPTLDGVAEGRWAARPPRPDDAIATKDLLLRAWDDADALLAGRWPQIPAARFLAVDSAFGLWTAPNTTTLLYLIDNEIHHRGQGYVYLRMLGVTPPPFYER